MDMYHYGYIDGMNYAEPAYPNNIDYMDGYRRGRYLRPLIDAEIVVEYTCE